MGRTKAKGARVNQDAVHPDDFQELSTFTGETVWYNAATHVYIDAAGQKLVSVSEYAESMMPEFPLEAMSQRIASKHNVDVAKIRAMWEMNGLISRTFGNALHYSMEQWFLHRECGTSKEYHLPKPPYLREAVMSFPLKNKFIVPEAVLSDVAGRRVGRTDGLYFPFHDEEPKMLEIVDFKSDNDVTRNLERHQHQLNFYRAILEAKGFTVTRMVIWNYVKKWSEHEVNKIAVLGSK